MASKWAHEQFAAKGRKAVVQLARCFLRADCDRFLDVDRAAVESRGHGHEADASLLVAGEYRGLDGRRAAPARQQRSVYVETAFRRDIENALRKDQPVGRDDEDIRFERGNLRNDLRVFERRGLQHVDALVECELFDRACGKALAPTCRTVWLRQDRERHDTGIRQCLERREREFRRTGKQHSRIAHDAVSAIGAR